MCTKNVKKIKIKKSHKTLQKNKFFCIFLGSECHYAQIHLWEKFCDRGIHNIHTHWQSGFNSIDKKSINQTICSTTDLVSAALR